jgi:beta-glucosidase
VKELKGFRKIFLKAGESQNVSIALERSAIAFYDPERRAWAAEKGDYKIVIGASSRDIRLQENVRLTESTYEK